MLTLTRRSFLASLPVVSAAFARAANPLPANRNVKWALSSALWRNLPPVPFSEIMDVMEATGFVGIRLAGFPEVLHRYGLTASKLQAEMARRKLSVVSISWGAALEDPAQRQKVLASAKSAMTFLADCGASHLVVFPGNRNRGASNPEAAFKEVCARCNQIGELARGMGFTAGLHNHMGELVQTPEEIDRFMALTDPRLFGLSPDTAHLRLAGCDVVATLERYKDRIHFLDYKDAKPSVPGADMILAGGRILSKNSTEAKFLSSIYDLGDGDIDFPGCHRVLKSVDYRGWICVDLDIARRGPRASYEHCQAYVTQRLEPIYS